jgi:hypothetical protein
MLSAPTNNTLCIKFWCDYVSHASFLCQPPYGDIQMKIWVADDYKWSCPKKWWHSFHVLTPPGLATSNTNQALPCSRKPRSDSQSKIRRRHGTNCLNQSGTNQAHYMHVLGEWHNQMTEETKRKSVLLTIT